MYAVTQDLVFFLCYCFLFQALSVGSPTVQVLEEP